MQSYGYMRYSAQVSPQDLQSAHNSLSGLIDKRTSVYRAQWKVLRDGFGDAIRRATTCYQRGEGLAEINDLYQILQATNRHLYEYRGQQWTDALYQPSGSDPFISAQVKELDNIQRRFAYILHENFDPTEIHIGRARETDHNWMNQFVEGVGRATPHGDFARAYQNRDISMLNTLADRTLNEQSQILATAGDDQEDEVRKAKDLINWIMNVTKRPPEPRLLLGQRFVGQLEKFQATAKYDLFKSRFVTGEMVVVKVLRANLSGKDDADMISKFQKRAEIWYNLHSDHTLQFYGIGKMDINNQPHIYSVSPYMKHGDAVQYHQNYPVPAAQSLQIALDAARGLQYLHEKRPPIIHLGLCTNDVLIDDSRQGVLGGFGLIEEASGSPPPNHPGFSSEFYRFLAPEHVNGTPARKTSADVWSWGMVALHLVGEKAPFCDSSDFQAGRFASDGARPKRERYPRVEEIPNSDTFWQLLEECWTRDEAKRPTMDDVVFRMKQLSALDNIPKPLPTVMDQPLPDGTTELGRRTSPVSQGPARGPRPGHR